MKRFDISAKLETVRGFLDDPDTHQAVVSIDESAKGKWVEYDVAMAEINKLRLMYESKALVDRLKGRKC